MELDLLFEVTVAKPWPNGLRAAEQEKFRSTIEQVKLADKLGFRTAWFVEHHFREGRSHSSAPEVTLGALTQVTENIRLGFGVALMPHRFTPPMRVAEKVATADILSNGRVEWGTGRSTPGEQGAFGVPHGEESRKQWADAIKSVVAMWHEDRFSWDSEYLQFPTPRPVLPKPYQTPHPPAWTAAVSEGSAANAGKAGLGLLSFSILRPLETMARHIREYREAAQNPEPLTEVVQNRVGAYTLVHCAESLQKAESYNIWENVWWWYQNAAELALEWDFPEFSQTQRDAVFPLLKKRAEGDFDIAEFTSQDMVIVGDPEQVLAKMKRYADAGVDQLICYCEFGHLTHEQIMENLELLGTKVLPEIRKYEPNPDAFKPGDDATLGDIVLAPSGITGVIRDQEESRA
jgi:alkanesulfonate monooxygenase SsuD/methylene tetrahydromethanopterin reductase-like flavin-dependent oxidoreductase (luciferase family)